MKNPRRIEASDEWMKAQNLSAAPPPPGSLFWAMWDACQDVAQQALRTPYIQGIRAGTLDPGVYGSYNVSDAFYCFDGTRDYSAAAKRAKNETLKRFLEYKSEKYAADDATFPTTWRVKEAASIVPYDVTRHYAEFEHRVVTEDDPIYAIVVMLPCEYLWSWLAAQIGPANPQNLYASWITGNESTKGPFLMGNFLDSYEKENGIDRKRAIDICRTATTFEMENFATVLK